MEALKLIPYVVLAVCIAGVIAGVSSISLAEFGNSMDKCADSNATWAKNGTALFIEGRCAFNSTDTTGYASTEQWNATYNAQEGVGTISEQFGTIAIIGVMVIIISLIAGVFVYMKYFG